MDRQVLLGLNHYKNKNGIIVFESHSVNKANEVAAEIIEKYSDFKTAIFLSGGITPKKFYEYLANKKSLKVGAVGQIDEKFGKKDHRNSNEMMIKNTGILEYFENQNIRFYPILQQELSIEDTALQYDEALRFILKYIPKSAGVLGIGTDGNIAGIPAINEIVKRMSEEQGSLVSFYEAEKYGSRITLNFQGLSMLDLIIVLVIGQEKREALQKMFKEGSVEDYPARFYLQPEIAKKTILITDQVI